MRKYHPLDSDAFRDALKSDTRKFLADFRLAVPDETLYSFVFYTNGEGMSVYPSLNTEEGLLRRAAYYINERGWPNEPELMAKDLRWNPCDWAYHEWGGEGYFAESSKCLFSYEWIIPDDNGANVPYEHNDSFEADCVFFACLEALSELNAEGVFGEGDERGKLMVGLFMGDQSDEERIRWARMVNPPLVAKRMQAEIEAGTEAVYRIREIQASQISSAS